VQIYKNILTTSIHTFLGGKTSRESLVHFVILTVMKLARDPLRAARCLLSAVVKSA